MKMHVGRWGNSLAIRLSRQLTQRFGIVEGDEIDDAGIAAVLEAREEDEKAHRRAEALDAIRRTRIPLPADWKFDREEANWRPAMDRW